MSQHTPSGPLDFLHEPLQPVSQAAPQADDPADRLPQGVVDELMRLPGVDGVWIEHDSGLGRVVVIHHTTLGSGARLPRQVNGMPTRIVGGEPIRAQR